MRDLLGSISIDSQETRLEAFRYGGSLATPAPQARLRCWTLLAGRGQTLRARRSMTAEDVEIKSAGAATTAIDFVLSQPASVGDVPVVAQCLRITEIQSTDT